ncbi:hypothetical protein [Tanticharoenia sakaeratensis]|uniref:Uncharacterized protein n=1 Tax=Tanticharoenia sakaeratensis NBRC 103193 TaxID=1231623 RepID=A0A0D6MPB7_9PROT|nr:hypothetical protein [Tanticharoenia sakaeratensis]GAN55235.1 hypothetical protein Tasa_041_030 [Tanticharoenia sakaeratensis NBRC 103193]GBQ23317.1 hypothetical protein AA103193_2373 [Tanticharoenia sakaeratensis NBRC 103193]
MQIAHRPPNAVAAPLAYVPASGEVKALLDAASEGLAVWARDLTPSRVVALRDQLARVEAAAAPTPPEVIASWLHQLRDFVSNPPADRAAMKVAAIAETCADIPIGAWTPASRMAWVRQPDRNGYPVGSRWPAPGELRGVLLPFAEKIRREASGLRALLAKSEAKPDFGRRKPTAEERAAVAARAAAFRDEISAREAEERAEREIAAMLPDVSLRGEAMIAALEAALPNMAPALQAVAQSQIAMHRKAIEMAAAFTGEVAEKTA